MAATVRRAKSSSGEFWWHFTTMLAVIAAVIVNGLVAYGADQGRFSPGIARFANTLAYFTIQANILTGIVACLLIRRIPFAGSWFPVLRTTALIAITIAGIVYH